MIISVVGILGLSYKPETDVIEKSQSVEVAKILSEKGIKVLVYDPAAMENVKKVLGDKVTYASSVKECIQDSDILTIAVPWAEFWNINPAWFEKKKQEPVVIDCWRILDITKLDKVRYLAIGKYNPDMTEQTLVK